MGGGAFLLCHWQQLLIKSWLKKQAGRQRPSSLWIRSPFLAFPSATPLLWIPFTWADRSSTWGGEKGKHILDSHVIQYKPFFFLEAAIIEKDTEPKRLPGLFQVWSEQNFDKATPRRKSCKGVCWCCSSADWESSRQQNGWSFTSNSCSHVVKDEMFTWTDKNQWTSLRSKMHL